IRTDGGTQPRAGIDLDVVAEYADVYLADPLRMPPVAVTYDGATYWLTDGFHRLEAAKTADLARIRAVVEPGTRADAQWRSYAANATHGLRRTNADKERAIRAALRHPNAAEMSNSALAAHLGVTDKSVAKYRQKMESTSEIPKSTTRTGTDGRTINTANIGPKPSPDRLPDWAKTLATPDEVADAIDANITFRDLQDGPAGTYRMKYNWLLDAKRPDSVARTDAHDSLAKNGYTLVDDYDGDLLLDGIRTLLQRTMQAEIDRIDAEEAQGRKPTPTPVDLDAPTSGIPKSTPPADTQATAYTPLDKTAINLALDAMNTAKRHVA
ncbi:MAG: ParB N-terminal domain-containing protein, partial [Caldilineaceae bacterium]|nr:ParB N-terminal domain-containing protein [Caldilineaceae bacterium]